ncbi:hypothetical protein GCM10009552_43270 [Rothia nasimurium]|uniref:Uncharacterized protein n=1 Tax=Luteibacter anthropi TaxID=564369 RepID=A0A7X5UCD2_9GAMM|nr:hypothetical protein [Luteibacter anthropi]NII07855.1 hypothetical protein [Luteibacter anthropi]
MLPFTALPVVPLVGVGIVMLGINAAVYIDRRHGRTRACRSARDFCVVAFFSFLLASFALLDLSTDVWIQPEESIALMVLHGAGGVFALSTASAAGFCIATRLSL